MHIRVDRSHKVLEEAPALLKGHATMTIHMWAHHRRPVLLRVLCVIR